jgi:dihydroflavonol-4-reductase
MKVLLTGATGFVGSELARALLARGESVRCLSRASSRRDNLEGLDVEIAVGDLTDRPSLDRAIVGCDTLFHCAADYRLFAHDPRELYASNVQGTDNMLAAAADANVSRVVYTSTVGALGLRGDGVPAGENTPVALKNMLGHYKRSKFLAERKADEWVARGLPVVIVNPSTPVGERDIKPTDTGKMIVDFLNRRIPAYVETGLNLIDVRDVAAGHILAAEKGRVGERYILGNQNLRLRHIFEALAEITGLPAPTKRLPHWIPIAFAAVDTTLARLIPGRQPRVSLEAARLARYMMFFDPQKAVRELGLPQTPVEQPLRRAVDWFTTHGYVHT